MKDEIKEMKDACSVYAVDLRYIYVYDGPRHLLAWRFEDAFFE